MRYMKAVIRGKGSCEELSLGADGFVLVKGRNDFYCNPEVLYCPVGDQSAKNYISMDVIKRFIFDKCSIEGLLTSDFIGDGYWYYDDDPSLEDMQIANTFIETARLGRI